MEDISVIASPFEKKEQRKTPSKLRIVPQKEEMKQVFNFDTKKDISQGRQIE